MCHLIGQAAAQGARLALFPEALILAYPRGLGFGTVIGNRTEVGWRAYARYWDAAVDVPGPLTERIGEAAAASISRSAW